LWALFPAQSVRRLIVGSLTAHVIVLGLTGWAIGPVVLLKTAGAALVIAFMAQEILIVSQHTHIPMPLSGGHVVRPHRALEQEVFTRSMRLPGWLSRLTLQFDAHELHHMYPFVPGYLLHRVPYTPVNEVSWRRWIPAARSMPGEVLFFQNRDGSGFDL
jgi:fatty acid desaturase